MKMLRLWQSDMLKSIPRVLGVIFKLRSKCKAYAVITALLRHFNLVNQNSIPPIILLKFIMYVLAVNIVSSSVYLRSIL